MDGSLQSGLVAVARGEGLSDLIRSWNPDEGLLPLLSNVDEEPVAAALWEVLWRFEPRLSERIGQSSSYPSPNPFLQGYAEQPAGELSQWPWVVADRDLDAAFLLAAAIRVEHDRDWPNPRKIADRYVSTWREVVESATPGFEDPESALSVRVPETPMARAEHMQQMFTRLLLLGKSETSSTLLTIHAQLVAEDLRRSRVG